MTDQRKVSTKKGRTKKQYQQTKFTLATPLKDE